MKHFLIQTLGITCLFILVTQGFTQQPKLDNLKEEELSGKGYYNCTWLSKNGLNLYYQFTKKGDGNKRTIWVTKRENINGLFKNAKKMFDGSDLTLSGDELEIIFLDGQKLYSATRNNINADFNRPSQISELNKFGFLASPCLSDDGLMLWVEQIGEKASRKEAIRFERTAKTKEWGNPKTVTLPPLGAKSRFLFVSQEKAYGLCMLIGGTPIPNNNIAIFTTTDKGLTFENSKVLTVPNISIQGKFPRYNEASKSLLFTTEANKEGETQIYMLSNFELPLK